MFAFWDRVICQFKTVSLWAVAAFVLIRTFRFNDVHGTGIVPTLMGTLLAIGLAGLALSARAARS